MVVVVVMMVLLGKIGEEKVEGEGEKSLMIVRLKRKGEKSSVEGV